jgi:hypothetical protein
MMTASLSAEIEWKICSYWKRGLSRFYRFSPSPELFPSPAYYYVGCGQIFLLTKRNHRVRAWRRFNLCTIGSWYAVWCVPYITPLFSFVLQDISSNRHTCAPGKQEFHYHLNLIQVVRGGMSSTATDWRDRRTQFGVIPLGVQPRPFTPSGEGWDEQYSHWLTWSTHPIWSDPAENSTVLRIADV